MSIVIYVDESIDGKVSTDSVVRSLQITWRIQEDSAPKPRSEGGTSMRNAAGEENYWRCAVQYL